jgi:hypothetical protein
MPRGKAGHRKKLAKRSPKPDPAPYITYDDDPENPAYNKEGVDLTVIRGFLDKTPEERLLTLKSFANGILKIRALNAHL